MVIDSPSAQLPAPLPALALLSALQEVRDGILVYHANQEVVRISPQAARLLGAGPEIPRRLEDLFGGCAEADGAKEVLAYLNSERAPEAERILALPPGGQVVRLHWRELDGDYRIAFVDPVDSAQDRDFLTNIATRRSFESQLKGILAAGGRSVAVLLVDLDRFKAVNDELGHAMGDTLLKRVAERMRSAVRTTDVVARFGGDEFAILLDGVEDASVLSGTASRVIDRLRRPFLIEGRLISVGASIGIATALSNAGGSNASDSHVILQSADLALYESKSAGGNCFRLYDPRMRAEAEARRNGELDLRRALAARQFELHFQPQVDLEGRLRWFEALIRWRHPERGLIPPLDFLPLAERFGLMGSIGEWVLRTACQEAAQWPSAIGVAVNATTAQITDPQFPAIVRRALKLSGLAPSRLEIEVTEGSLMANPEAGRANLEELQAIGVQFAIDDFGTGYASLSQLVGLPFDKVKIDRCLSGSEGDSPKKRALIRAITELSKQLGMASLVEGVENAEQIERLMQDGCEMLQGYYIGRPAPAEEVRRFVHDLEEAAPIFDEKGSAA
jgi:diguanylate cyclase (GGDEF)-like protein